MLLVGGVCLIRLGMEKTMNYNQEIKVDKSIYSLDVLLKTAFSFTDRIYLHLAQDEKSWIISWKAKDEVSIDAEEFENELIMQQLRERITEKTAEVRKLLLARAFSSSIIEAGEDRPAESDSENPFRKELEREYDSSNVMKGWFDT